MSDSETPKKAESAATAALFSPPSSPAATASSGKQPEVAPAASGSPFGLLFQAPDLSDVPQRKRTTSAPKQESPSNDSDGGSGDGGLKNSGKGNKKKPAAKQGAPEAKHGDSTKRSGDDNSSSKKSAGSADAPSENSVPENQKPGKTDSSPSPDQDSDGGNGGDSDAEGSANGRRRKRGGKGRRSRGGGDFDDNEQNSDDRGGEAAPGQGGSRDESANPNSEDSNDDGDADGSSKRRRRRRRGEGTERAQQRDEVTGVKGSTRLEAKRQRRREGREAGRRRTIITEAEFLARRESVERVMVVRGREDRTQIGVLEDGVLVEHYVSRETQSTMVGNVYLGRVQNVLPSMEAAFVDIGKGRNAVLYAGEVNWDTAGMEGGQPRRIENALSSGDSVLVQVTKDPIGHKGARLTSQVSLPGRYLVYVPGNSMTGISRKLPDTERTRLKKILKEVVPADAGVIVRTAAEGASEAELRSDVERLTGIWERTQKKSAAKSANAPVLLHGEPDMTVRVIRDVFNEDFSKLVVSGARAWDEVSNYIESVAPDLADRVEQWTKTEDIFTAHRVSEALAKAMDRKVWLPSGGSLVIDRTEAMTVVDVNTGKFVGSGGNLEETVTKNNIEAAEEIVRQLRLRDIGGIIVIDFIDMVLESNRDLVVRRLLECLGRDRTKHQVAEVTSLGLVQMTRKRVGAGLIEVFSEPCAHCAGRGLVVHTEPVERPAESNGNNGGQSNSRSRSRKARQAPVEVAEAPAPSSGPTAAQIAAAAHAAALAAGSSSETANATAQGVVADVVTETPSAKEPAKVETKVETQDSPEPAAVVPAPSAPRKRGSRRAKAPQASAASAGGTLTAQPQSAAPVTTIAGTASVASSGTATAPDVMTVSAPVKGAESDVEITPDKPRRRGRVVAPAGPPVTGSEEA